MKKMLVLIVAVLIVVGLYVQLPYIVSIHNGRVWFPNNCQCKVQYRYYVREPVIKRELHVKTHTCDATDTEELIRALQNGKLRFNFLDIVNEDTYTKKVVFTTRLGLELCVWVDGDSYNSCFLGNGMFEVRLESKDYELLLSTIRKYIDREHEVEVLAG